MVALLLGVLSAEAGQIFYLDMQNGNILSRDTRSLVEDVVAPSPPEVAAMFAVGMAYDDAAGELWMYGPSGGWGYPSYVAFSIPLLRSTQNAFAGSQDVSALSMSGGWLAGRPVAFDYLSLNAIHFTQVLFLTGAAIDGADWCDECDAILALSYAGDFYEVHPDTGLVLWRGHMWPAIESELAYDSDTRVLWLVDQYGWLYGLETEQFSVVAYLEAPTAHVFTYDGGAGSIDDVGPQTPELLVTGECPGTVYVTAVDATPGAHVQFASGTRLGRRAVRSGPCAGVAGGLANPVPRYELVTGASGIASTTFQATAPMCGALAIQALDVGSCQTTSVRFVPDPVVP